MTYNFSGNICLLHLSENLLLNRSFLSWLSEKLCDKMLNIEELSKELMNTLSRVKCIYTYIYKGNIYIYVCVHVYI